MSDVGSDRLRDTRGFFYQRMLKNILGPEILVGSHRMLDRTGSTVYAYSVLEVRPHSISQL
jgi:hypothetical protein